MFDFDATFGPQRKEKLFKEKLTDNSPCQNCEEYLLSINNPYFISDKCSTCKDAVIWRAKCIEKLAIYENENYAKPIHAKWETIHVETITEEGYAINHTYYKCTNCSNKIDACYRTKENFCSHCGAIMDGEKQ